MTRIMYDSIQSATIPENGQIVAGYVNGRWPDYEQLVTRFPALRHVSITVTAGDIADVLDVENLDATPAEAVNWAKLMRAFGRIPTVYVDVANWPAVRAAFAAVGEAPPLYWIARYDGVAAVPDGAIAKQYADHPGYDISIVADYWPGVDPAPEEADMSPYLISVTPDPTGQGKAGIYTVDGGWATHVDEASYPKLQARFGDPVDVSPTYFAGLKTAPAPARASAAAVEQLPAAEPEPAAAAPAALERAPEPAPEAAP